jgi:predicted nucleic acid-binding protein
MDKLVVDSSVVVKWFVAEPYSEHAHHVLEGYQNGTLELYVPDLLFAEVANVIWKKHRVQGLSKEDAQQIIETFRQLNFHITPTVELFAEAYRFAVAHDRTVYDSLYIVLSQREQCLFLTSDERLANALSTEMSNVVWVGNW